MQRTRRRGPRPSGSADGSYRPIGRDTWPPDLGPPETITPEQLRAHPWYAMWRAAVMGRDDHTCQHCGATGVGLHAHHIWPIALYQEFAFKVNNGQALCVPCHEYIHRLRREANVWQRRWNGQPEPRV